RRRPTISDRDWSSDVCSSDLARIQRAIRILKNHLQLAPPRAQLRAFEFRELFALKQNAAGSRLDETHNRAAQRCLAAAALAHQRSEERRVGKEWTSRAATCRG